MKYKYITGWWHGTLAPLPRICYCILLFYVPHTELYLKCVYSTFVTNLTPPFPLYSEEHTHISDKTTYPQTINRAVTLHYLINTIILMLFRVNALIDYNVF